MPELYSDYQTRQQPVDAPSALAGLPPAALAHRRRIVRGIAIGTFLVGLGLSAIPGAHYGIPLIQTHDGGVTTVQEFKFVRQFGFPFNTATGTYGEVGLDDVSVHPEGVLGNLAIAAAGLTALTRLIRRRRRGG